MPRRPGLADGLLQWLGHHLHVLVRVEIAVVGKWLAPPSPHYYFQRLQEAAAAFRVRHVVAIVVLGQSAPPDSELEPALADMVHCGGFLGDPQGVGQQQHLHGQPDSYSAGPGGDGAGDYQWRGQYRPLRAEVVLCQPHRVHAHLLCPVNLVEGLFEGLRLAHALANVDVGEHAEIHIPLLVPGKTWASLVATESRRHL